MSLSNTTLVQALCREAALWKMTDNQNVLKFIGLSRIDDKRFGSMIALTSPWMRNGNLLAYAESHAEVDKSRLVRRLLNSSLLTIFHWFQARTSSKWINISTLDRHYPRRPEMCSSL